MKKSETKIIKPYEIYIRGRKFTLVDTPGFDDEDLTDSDVLKLLVDWLVTTYKSGQKLSGILYLHRVSDTRMRGSSVRNLAMFQQLIGDDFYKNVTLATTCWSLVPFHVGLERETELKTNSNFWKLMLSKGAHLKRIPDAVTAARDLVYEIASHNAAALQTQRDVVERGISFSNLAVTKTVQYELEKMKREQAAERARHAERLAHQEREMRRELADLKAENQRIQDALQRTRWCSGKKPHGTCDNRYCSNKLKRWAVIWRRLPRPFAWLSTRLTLTIDCCSCRLEGDDYWHCGPCSNDCGNDEHPSMSRIDNDDDCVIM